ncbi:MAG: hypothetical protein HOI66_19125, partial [Verrucomicrobia bacterium]|nr:hypothetical protein [Verrucomicrobiota bacterium]
MYSIDPLRASDSRMRWFAAILIVGFVLLVAGLWHLQVVSFKKYERYREVQSTRTVREPAIRGKIFDRNGIALADNRPNYKVVMFLEELRPLFQSTFKEVRSGYQSLTRSERTELGKLTRYGVASNIWFQVTSIVGPPMKLHRRNFERHYKDKLYVPLTIVKDLTGEQVAQFVEKGAHIPGVDMEHQSIRQYPNGSLASHVLGYLQKSDPMKQEDAEEFSYHKIDYKGVSGIERIFDNVLSGEAGVKSILINNLMFRQEETVFEEPVPGDNLYLTLDARIQLASEEALASMGPKTMGAVVVMDVNNGDVVAMASAPTYDPNEFVERFNEINSDPLLPQLNRAAYGIYAPGSIFKMVVGMAFLENGVDPRNVYESLGYLRLNGRFIDDTAEAGQYDFYRAFAKSSNSYFIEHGLAVGIETLIDWGDRFFIGQKTGLLPQQELGGAFPSIERVRKGWHEGETANLCIGQGAIAVTPLQMAVMTAAVANGGTVYKPRIASRVEPQRGMMSRQAREFPAGVIRGKIGASKRVIQILHDAMLLDVAGGEGSGHKAKVEGLNIGGKTGTAETNKRINGRKIKDTWFV